MQYLENPYKILANPRKSLKPMTHINKTLDIKKTQHIATISDKRSKIDEKDRLVRSFCEKNKQTNKHRDEQTNKQTNRQTRKR